MPYLSVGQAVQRLLEQYGGDRPAHIAQLYFYRRWADTERALIAMIFAENGDCREGVRLARDQGIRQHSFLVEDDRWLWLAAEFCRDTAQAVRVGWLFLQQQSSAMTRADYDALCRTWYWDAPRIHRTAAELSRFARIV